MSEQLSRATQCPTCRHPFDACEDEAAHCFACEDRKALDDIANILDLKDPADATPADIERIGEILRGTCRTVRDQLTDAPERESAICTNCGDGLYTPSTCTDCGCMICQPCKIDGARCYQCDELRKAQRQQQDPPRSFCDACGTNHEGSDCQ